MGNGLAWVKWRRWVLKLLKLVAIAYVVCCALLYLGQEWLIFPGASTRGTAAARVRVMAGQELVPVRTRGGDTVYVLFGEAMSAEGRAREDAGSRPTLIYFYGNAMSVSGCWGEFDHFRRLGANVAVVEYAGYGLSTGKPSERSFVETEEAAYDYVVGRKDVDARQVIAVGWSIGGAAAIDLASRRPVAGVATFSAFTSMRDMGRKQLPWFPTSLFLKHRFENESKLKGMTVPVFLAHGTEDELVPFAMSGRLAAAAAGRATVVPVKGAGHNDIFDVGGAGLMRAMGEFVERVHSSGSKS